MRSRLKRWVREERASETTSSALLTAMATVIGVAVFGAIAVAIYKWAQHWGQCLNGC